MSGSGYYRMHRGWMSHRLFTGEPFSKAQAWCWLIENAAWREDVHHVACYAVAVTRGQLAASVRYLADAWKWPKSNAARFLDKLCVEGMIDRVQSAAGHPLLITILNYQRYQADGPSRGNERLDRQGRDGSRDAETPGNGWAETDMWDNHRDTSGTPFGTCHGTLAGTPVGTVNAAEKLGIGEGAGTESGTSNGSRPGTLGGTKKRKTGEEREESSKHSHGAPEGWEGEFEEWWLQVPRKVAKGSAKLAFRKARAKAPFSDLLAGITRYSHEVAANAREERFICHPATWLNGERWNDQPLLSSGAEQSPTTSRPDEYARRSTIAMVVEEFTAPGATPSCQPQWRGSRPSTAERRASLATAFSDVLEREDHCQPVSAASM